MLRKKCERATLVATAVADARLRVVPIYIYNNQLEQKDSSNYKYRST